MKDRLHYLFVVLIIISLCLISVHATIAQTPTKKGKKLRINNQEIWHKERVEILNRSTCARMSNRTIDGTCNNISNMANASWGAADIQLLREMSPAYDINDHFNAMGGTSRQSPRAISNIVVSQMEDLPSTRGLSSMVFTWGQFLDHDITLTPEGHTEYAPVILPLDEPLFTTDIPFFRSLPMAGTGSNNARQQQNIITSWIDASNVYGSEQTRADWLRTFEEGKLKMSAGRLLPYNTVSGEIDGTIDINAPSMAGDGDGENVVFVAGDVRANEQPGLTSLHTLFVREHNRICNELLSDGMTDDEEIYQEAKRRVGGLMQAITYEEFLPALGVEVPEYEGYDDDLQPDITNLFATAAYRLGHTMVTDEILLLDNECQPINGGSLALLEGFFNPSVIPANGIAAFLQGLATQTQQQVDTKIVDNLRNFLFPSNGGPAFGLDLASLNLQRGRDHGLPSYFATRAYYTGTIVNSFADITSDPALQEALESAYGNVYDIDVWVGLLAEDHLPNASIGTTLNSILGKQFANLRDADFYYYANDPEVGFFLENEIENTSLADIIVRNTAVSNIQDDVFFSATCTPSNDDDDDDDDDDGDGDGNNGGGNGGGGNNGGGNGGGGNGGGGNGGGNGGGGNGGGGNGGGGNGGGGNGGGGNGGGGNGGGGNGGGGNGGGGNGGGGNPGGNGGGGNPGGNLIDQNDQSFRLEEIQQTPSVTVYPNPSSGAISIDLTLLEDQTNGTITIQDLNGNKIHNEKVSVYNQQIYHEMILDNAVPGIYLVIIESGDEIFTEKIVIE